MMLPTRNIWAAGLLMLAPVASSAAEISRFRRASTAVPFLRMGVGARAAAMGEAYGALVDEASAVYWNPAALIRIPRRSATFMHQSAMDSFSVNYLAYSHNLKDYGAVGGSFHYISAGELTARDASNVETGKYKPHDMAIALSYAYQFKENIGPKTFENPYPQDEFPWLNGTMIGMTVKMVRSVIQSKDETASFDLGVLTPDFWQGRARASVVVQNLGGDLRFDQENEVLPFAGRLGLGLTLSEEWKVGLEGVIPRQGPSSAGAGAEHKYALNPRWTLLSRLGFNSLTVNEINGFTGVSMGLGLNFGEFTLDYAFVPMGTLGSSQLVSLTARF